MWQLCFGYCDLVSALKVIFQDNMFWRVEEPGRGRDVTSSVREFWQEIRERREKRMEEMQKGGSGKGNQGGSEGGVGSGLDESKFYYTNAKNRIEFSCGEVRRALLGGGEGELNLNVFSDIDF
jgi:hypothetical protein